MQVATDHLDIVILVNLSICQFVNLSIEFNSNGQLCSYFHLAIAELSKAADGDSQR
jgi:hypothetical protein